MASVLRNYIKDPSAQYRVTINWTPWLQGETISTATWISSSADLTVISSAISGGRCSAILGGGTEGAYYTVTCRVTTSGSRIDDRSVGIRVEQR